MNHTTLPSPIQQWLDEQGIQGRSQHTIAAYSRALHHFVQWYEAAYQAPCAPPAVMPRDIRDWKAFQQTVDKAAPATINQRLVAVNRFFAWARRHQLVPENPAEDVPRIALPARQPRGLRPEQLRRLLRAARANRRDYALLELCLGTGLRVGEVLALQVGDLQLSERSGMVTVRRGKRDSFRQVPLTHDVRNALQAYLAHDHPEAANPAAPLWVGSHGPLTHRSSVLRLLEKYCKQAGIEPINPHALRHTFATRYLDANPDDLRGLAKLLGHATLNTVMIYTEPDFDDLVERLERVEASSPRRRAKGSGR